MFPKHFILVFLFLLFDFGVEGYEFGLCSKVGLTINAYSNANNELVYMYMADLTLSPADAYYTNISISQQFAWSSDPSIYYQNVSSWPGCSSIDGDCSFIYEDGPVWQTHSVMMDGEIVNFDLMTLYMIDRGTYYGVYDTFHPKQPPCMPDVGGNANFTGKITYCCKKYEYFTIPDVDPNPCLELSGVTVFQDGNKDPLSIFLTNYEKTPEGINFTIKGLMISGDRTFVMEPNWNLDGCAGSAQMPFCSLFYADTTSDFQIDMFFYSYYASDKWWAALINMNKLIRRNGTFMQNHSQPFTVENSCTPELSPPNGYGTVSTTTLCCTKFQQPTGSSLIAKQKLEKIVNNAKMCQKINEKTQKNPEIKLFHNQKQPRQKQRKQNVHGTFGRQ